MAVVDSHVHLLPGRLGEKVRAVFAAGEANGAFSLAYPADHAAVADRLVVEGIDEIWCLPYSHKKEVAEGLNGSTAGIVRSFAGHRLSVVGGATVHPDDDSPADVIERAVNLHGLRVLKLHCSVGGFRADDPRLRPAYRAAEERRMPVVIHLGHATNGLTEEHEMDAVSNVCRAHPDLPVVLAHFGHHSSRAAGRLFAEHANFHADLTPVVTAAPDVTHGMLSANHDRILFGSDAPNTAISAADHMSWLRSFGLEDAHLDAILGGNARRLTGAVVAE